MIWLEIPVSRLRAPRNDALGKPSDATTRHHRLLPCHSPLLYVVLALQVSRLRQGNRVVFGDGDNIKLRSAIRAHANFAEYVPIIALMVGMLEMSGAPAARVHLMMGALLLARLIHPIGMYVGPRTLTFQICRVGGILLTLLHHGQRGDRRTAALLAELGRRRKSLQRRHIPRYSLHFDSVKISLDPPAFSP